MNAETFDFYFTDEELTDISHIFEKYDTDDIKSDSISHPDSLEELDGEEPERKRTHEYMRELIAFDNNRLEQIGDSADILEDGKHRIKVCLELLYGKRRFARRDTFFYLPDLLASFTNSIKYQKSFIAEQVEYFKKAYEPQNRPTLPPPVTDGLSYLGFMFTWELRGHLKKLDTTQRDTLADYLVEQMKKSPLVDTSPDVLEQIDDKRVYYLTPNDREPDDAAGGD